MSPGDGSSQCSQHLERHELLPQNPDLSSLDGQGAEMTIFNTF